MITTVIAFIIALVIGVIGGTVYGINKQKAQDAATIGDAETKARVIIDDALKNAEATKREAPVLRQKKKRSRRRMSLKKKRKNVAPSCRDMKNACWEKKKRSSVNQIH